LRSSNPQDALAGSCLLCSSFQLAAKSACDEARWEPSGPRDPLGDSKETWGLAKTGPKRPLQAWQMGTFNLEFLRCRLVGILHSS